ncbi:molybdenum cofactor guanylyltransferase, partial [Gammaproteobacteria bacterium]|nr:molybdenum cofactor guanylyltransferase [Gammaproteobacteria bacterium]
MAGRMIDSGTAVTGVILAGGAGRRMGGVDKGLVEWRGLPLVEHIIPRAQSQVETVVISANRNVERYRDYGLPVVSDRWADFQGPLAGFQAALAVAETPWLATFPCDSPLVPLDLVLRLRLAAEREDVPIACVHDGDRRQPIFALIAQHLG